PKRAPPTTPASLRTRLSRLRLRRFWPLILVPPALFVIFVFFMYLSILRGFTSPSSIILGAKGLEVLDRNGQHLFTFADQPGSSGIVPLEQISPDLMNATIA